MIPIAKLKGAIPDKVYDSLTPDFLLKANIDGKLRLSHFIGQTEEESGCYTREIENLNYSGAALFDKFSTHFKDLQEANSYARQPEKIANRIYANRMGNGDESSGDGWKYRGRGYIQITGKSNYSLFQDWVDKDVEAKVDFVNNPDLITQPPYDLLSAAWFFTVNKIWPVCDKGVDLATVTIVTRKINGGTIGLKNRYDYTSKIYNTLAA